VRGLEGDVPKHLAPLALLAAALACAEAAQAPRPVEADALEEEPDLAPPPKGTGGALGRDAATTTGGTGGTADAAVVPDAGEAPDADDPPADAGSATDDAAAMTLPGPKDPAIPPIGDGWKELFPTYKVDQPPGQSRYTLTDGEFHMWLFNTDASTYPGRDSGPRSELHIRNNYTTGQAQYQADIKIDPNCSGASVMQVFGGSSSATSFMAWVTGNNLTHYGAETIVPNIRGRYFRLNVTHDTASRDVVVYIDGQKKATYQDHGAATHYFKCGIYHQRNMTARCDIWFKNIRVFAK
jgi:hypothetical protein